MTNDEFIKKALESHKIVYDYSKVEYKDCKTPVTIICPIHGEFRQRPDSHLRGAGCPKCNKRRAKDTEWFIEEAKKVHGDRYDYSKTEYKGCKEKLTITCREHGDFYSLPLNHLAGCGCKKCMKEKFALGNDEFIKKAKAIHGDRYDYSKVDYKNHHTPVIIICLVHGDFKQRPGDHLRGHGCPICKESHLERDISLLLDENNIKYTRYFNEKWLGLQTLDFYLPEHNIAIECQGSQHFLNSKHWGKNKLEYTQDCDKKKLDKCIKHGVTLLYYSNLHIDYPYEVIEDKQLLLERIQQGITQ